MTLKKKLQRKAKVTINLESEVVKKAKEFGLNISKICENALEEYIEKLADSNIKIRPETI
ncbi:MAG: type II toxin-antitoxin system CcdA family antitoxin [Candidatus Bathyarchaeia archaeon]